MMMSEAVAPARAEAVAAPSKIVATSFLNEGITARAWDPTAMIELRTFDMTPWPVPPGCCEARAIKIWLTSASV
ncbi:MAG TPA: hypothetical protein VNZ53_50105 [Steroidobacteraceae bacterium]|nr:hypothetical protein [Steroidobacteraceae bacterium]